MRPRTESDCWMEISKAFETPPKRRKGWQTKMTAGGLCQAMDLCCPADWLDKYWQMNERIRRWMVWNSKTGFVWPARRFHSDHRRSHDLARSRQARRFAKDSA